MRQKLTGLINIKMYQQKHENQHHQRQKQVGMACIQLKLHHFKFSKHDHATADCVLCAARCHCIFYDAVSNTIRRRGGYRGVTTEEWVDTVTYFGGNHGSRV